MSRALWGFPCSSLLCFLKQTPQMDHGAAMVLQRRIAFDQFRIRAASGAHMTLWGSAGCIVIKVVRPKYNLMGLKPAIWPDPVSLIA